MRRSLKRMLWGAAGPSLLALVSSTIGAESRADGPSPSPSSPTPSRATPAPGTWTIVVVTSTIDPTSKALSQGLRSNPWVMANFDRVKLTEVNTDATGRPLTSGSTPVLVYQQGLRGPEMMGGRSGFAGPEDVVQWVRTLIASSAEGSVRDPNLTQTNLFGKGQPTPSAQAEAPSMPMSQPQSPAPVAPAYPQAIPQPQTTTTFAVPMTASPASVIQAPAQNFVIQQAPTQFMFAPPSAPMVYIPQPTAPSPTGNLYMTAAPAQNAMPMMAVAAPMQTPMPMQMPMQAVPVAPQPLAVAQPVGPAVAGASLTTSSFSVPASSTTSRVKVRGPGPVASALSRFGERLTTLGRTRIETVQETRLETQTAQTPPGQYMTLSSTSASPVLTSPPSPTAPAPVPTCPAPTAQSPQPSPQSGNSRWR
jgi:hypothetical protein